MIEIEGINYLTASEVCRLLGVKPATIYAYVSRGILRSYKQGIKRQRLYRADEVTALLQLRPGGEERGEAAARPPLAAPPSDEDVLPSAEGWMGEV